MASSLLRSTLLSTSRAGARSSLTGGRRLLSTTEVTTTTTTIPAGTVVSPSKPKLSWTSRFQWFVLGLSMSLTAGLWQLGEDASRAVKDLEVELESLRKETAETQRLLRGKIGKLEVELGKSMRNGGGASEDGASA